MTSKLVLVTEEKSLYDRCSVVRVEWFMNGSSCKVPVMWFFERYKSVNLVKLDSQSGIAPVI